MNNPNPPAADSGAVSLEAADRKELLSQLSADEALLAALTLDLDSRLNFSRGLIAVTDSRLLARAPGESDWRSWGFAPGLVLDHHDHAGVGSLELKDSAQRFCDVALHLGQ